MIFCPYEWVASDWSLTNISQNPNSKIIAVPVKFNLAQSWCYDQRFKDLQLDRYDLVILSDIEYDRCDKIYSWIRQNNIKKYVLATGGITPQDNFDESCMVYRPWWCYNLLRHNQYQDTNSTNKPYLFDILLGARRPHRDFVMLGMQSFDLLKSSIVTYREIFSTGSVVNHQTDEFASLFSSHKLHYPYVSENLDPQFEVQDQLEKSISRLVPWKIYSSTWYTVVAETLGTGSTFFLSEKTTKPLFAQRMFVVFSNAYFLRGLHNLGFETFGDIIDESYDNCVIDSQRFCHALEQLQYLSQQNHVKIYEKILSKLKHNHNRLFELQKQTKKQMKNLLLQNAVISDVVV